jgi:exodeoxyribonuclease V beta subunit
LSGAETRETFELCGPLPVGVTVLEASAGTGKTYTIAALATRYVAEGVPLDALLLVTFTRLATGELRDRVRQRLVDTRGALEAALADGGAPDIEAVAEDDELGRMLAAGTRTEVAERLDRLVRAIADFDAATITTTHGFCQEVLGSFGVAGDIDRAYTVSEDARDLTREVVDDLYVREFLDRAPLFSRLEGGQAVAAAVQNPGAPLAPAAQTSDGAAHARQALASRARAELDRRKRGLALMSYDDLVSRVRVTLEGEQGEEVARALRARYRVALVDEFQDTDPDQWTIMRLAFAHEDSTLVLIGDPKQAVYSFRGADVYAYLDAARHANAVRTLDTNWRSDQELLDAYDALFAEARLGHEDITYVRVRAAERDGAGRLDGAPVGTPLRFRILARGTPGVRSTPTGWSNAGSARAYVARDLAGEIATLLGADATLDDDGALLGASDVAVLVRTNGQAEAVKDALGEVGVPAVVNGAGSVFKTPAAQDWVLLLDALERPESLARARAVALTSFGGWSAEAVAGASDGQWDSLQQRLHSWAGVLRRSGVATLLEVVSSQQSLAGRLLSGLGGERELTDLCQLGELLHVAAADGGLGATALASWLRARIAGDDRDADAEARMRRLESDADAVQVLTIHRSKGLEFAVVYCPFLWNPFWSGSGDLPAVYHDPEDAQTRKVDVAMDPGDVAYRRHRAQSLEEQAGEELRLVYVALSRAKHQAVVWWATTYQSRGSPLGCLLFGGPPGARQSVEEAASAARDRLRTLVTSAPDSIGLERADIAAQARWSPPPRQPGDLAAAVFARHLDVSWRRLSFTSITAASYEARVASEFEEMTGSDDAPDHHPLGIGATAGEQAELLAVPSLLSDMPTGTRVGTLLHQVLEDTDFAAQELREEVSLRLADAQRWRTVELGNQDSVIDGLCAAIETRLGPLVGERRLRDIDRTDRLAELSFELPLVGGEHPDGELTLATIAAVLRDHLPADDVLAGYADRLTDPALKTTLRGYLTGTIDLVARIDGGFCLMDYKSNRLAAAGEPLTAWHHRPEALVEEMQRSHYALQAMLYTVALHRYLRWRVPGYDVERDRLAVLYLFLRGLTGEDTPRVDGMPCGVFAWQPSPALVCALSDVLDRGAPT